jgi:hypothetical protein
MDFPIPDRFTDMTTRFVKIPSKTYPKFHYKVDAAGNISTFANDAKEWPHLKRYYEPEPYDGSYLAEDWCVHIILPGQERANLMCFYLEHFESWVREIGNIGLTHNVFQKELGYLQWCGIWYPREKIMPLLNLAI